ncbi:MAG: IS30 family transposase [Paracoccus sp. (in: a-proteobacteria)]
MPGDSHQHIYSEQGRRAELWRHLPCGSQRRRGYWLRKRPPAGFAPQLSILFRPDVIAHSKQFGHWQADLVLFRQKYGSAKVSNMIERNSRFPGRVKEHRKFHLGDHGSDRQSAHAPAPQAFRSITFDRGSEFIDWPDLQAEVGIQTWFCEAQSPWQKDAMKNTNKRLRRSLCRDTHSNRFPKRSSVSCAQASTPRRASASASTPRPRYSRPTCWDAATDAWNSPGNHCRIWAGAST